MKELKYNNWTIYSDTAPLYYACNGTHTISFLAEYRGGTYSKIRSYYDMMKNRCYQSPRYTNKVVPLAQDMTFELLKNGMLWDYNNQCGALETYKRDIEPYYRKCKALGLSLYDDTEFLDNLFAEK